MCRGEECGRSAELSDCGAGWDGRGPGCETAFSSSVDEEVGSSRLVIEGDEGPDTGVSGCVDAFVWRDVSAFAVDGLKPDSPAD